MWLQNTAHDLLESIIDSSYQYGRELTDHTLKECGRRLEDVIQAMKEVHLDLWLRG